MMRKFVLVMGMIAAISIIHGCDVPNEPESSSGGGGGGGDGGGGGSTTATFTVTVKSNQSPNSPIQGATVTFYGTNTSLYPGYDYVSLGSKSTDPNGNASMSYTTNWLGYPDWSYVKADVSAIGFRSASTTQRKLTPSSPSTSETVYLAPE